MQFRPAAFFEGKQMELMHGEARSLDCQGKQLQLADGRVLNFSHLVVATGAENRVLPVPGAKLPSVKGLRTRADADAIKSRLGAGSRLAVIGAGFIGMEFAALASSRLNCARESGTREPSDGADGVAAHIGGVHS